MECRRVSNLFFSFFFFMPQIIGEFHTSSLITRGAENYIGPSCSDPRFDFKHQSEVLAYAGKLIIVRCGLSYTKEDLRLCCNPSADKRGKIQPIPIAYTAAYEALNHDVSKIQSNLWWISSEIIFQNLFSVECF